MAKAIFDYNRINKIILSPLQQQLIVVGLKIEKDIKQSMKRGKGKIYLKGANKDIIHQASSPGDPPAVDTGRLRASISTNWTESGVEKGKVDSGANLEDGIGNPGGNIIKTFSGEKFKVVVGTNVQYGPWLEFGTKRIAARPFIRPIFDKYKSLISKMLTQRG